MAKAAGTLTVPGVDLTRWFRGNQQVVLIPGSEQYSKLRTGSITLVDSNDVKLEAEVRAKFVGSLFNLVRDYGRESAIVAGQTFDPTMIFDVLDDAGLPIDPREIYTAVIVFVKVDAA